MSTTGLKYLYFIAGLAVLASWQFFDGAYNTITKPLLMPMLMLYLYERSKGQVCLQTLWIFAALVFAWLGDLALMFPDQYFLPGIGAFFITQILYIRLFVVHRMPYGKWSVIRTSVLVVYGGWLLTKLLPVAGDLAIPIALYGVTLVTMAAFAINGTMTPTPTSYRKGAIGAVLFVISDSLIAFDKFVSPLDYRELLVMSTYIVAQYLIVDSLIDRARA